jgi:uncharacterized repeat protein (TIGR02543 family)
VNHTVTFDSKDGTKVSTQTVLDGNKASKPKNPTLKGFTFVEWQTENGDTFNFSTAITTDITLVAKWK